MTYYGIYKITNLLNGKMYIGKHKTTNVDDGYMGSGIVINHALEKYGKENFRKEWLMFCEDEEEMNYMERVFVDQTWIDRSDTYNLKLGGEGGGCKGALNGMFRKAPWNKGKTNVYSERQLAKMKEAHAGKNNPMYGKHHSESVKEKIRDAFYGKPLAEEHKAKISAAHRGKTLTDQHKNALSIAHKGRHWYNNGTKSIMAYSCPDGFKPGRI